MTAGAFGSIGQARRQGRSLLRRAEAGAGFTARKSAGKLALRRISTTLALSLAGLLALAIGVAQAAPPKLISYGNFSSQTGYAMGIAVDQSTGDVYLGGVFSESHAPEGLNKFEPSGELLPPSPFGGAYNSGIAVNPTNGDVYAMTALPTEIEVRDPTTGETLSSFPVSASKNFASFTLVQIGVDSSGDVYVPVVSSNEVQEYSPTGTPLSTFTGTGAGALSKPTGVAVDSAGNLWVADAGNNRIEELSPADAPIREIQSEGAESVALDSEGNVFAVDHNSLDYCGSDKPPCFHLVEYDPTGAEVADIGAGSLGSEGLTLPIEVAVDDLTGRVYVGDGIKDVVWIYGSPTAPKVEKELAEEVGVSEAKLGALVDPGGLETNYRVEYGTTASYGQTTPFPEGNVGQGIASRTVWASASGLQPGTTYHYRMVATNELGTSYGADQTFTTEVSSETVCPNESFRIGFSANLPDCRAYEMVTPSTKASAQPDPEGEYYFDENLSASGEWSERFAFSSFDAFPGAQTAGENYLATRGPEGWRSEDVIPLQSYTALECPRPVGFAPTKADLIEAYSPELTSGILHDGGAQDLGELSNSAREPGCGAEATAVVPGEPLGVENLLLRDNLTGGYTLLNVAPPGVTPASAHFQGASANLSHVVFSEHAQLTPNAPAGVEDLYDWSGGALHLVTVLPDGTATVGSTPVGEGSAFITKAHIVSADGSHVLFTANGNLYVRIDDESTTQIDASRAGGSGGGGELVYANAEGSKVLFTDNASADLTSDTVPGSGTNLYLYELESGRLVDLTPVATPEFAALMSASEDGSYLYFIAGGVLSGSQANENGETAQSGQRNLYVWNDGAPTFIARLSARDGTIGSLSPNGALFAFSSSSSLTGYDNRNAAGAPWEEIFLYEAGSRRLACVSCDPSGEAPTVGTTLQTLAQAKDISTPDRLSNSGRLFFETAESLLPSDTNGQMDVYEYEHGQLRLISTGTSAAESLLITASEDGNDVFFLTRQPLLPQDIEEGANVIYDARVDGGFPAPAGVPPCTTADACRAPSATQPSIYGPPASQTFSGTGNLAAPPEPQQQAKRRSKPKKCRKGFVRKSGKCVKKARRNARKSAHVNKRTGK